MSSLTYEKELQRGRALYSYDNSSFTWAEQDLYGSNRLGMLTPGLTIQSSAPLANANYNSTGDPITNGTEGKRTYELTNHLGNVMVTISDRKTGVDENGDAVIDYYKAEVLTAQDYYAFGMIMPGRTYSNAGAKYKYGFNGKENDNEVKGDGNQQDYGMRIYDPRLGRFLSVDPLTRKYPGWSPYAFAMNSPIAGIDLDGLEFYFAADGSYLGQSKNGETQIRVATEYHINPKNNSQLIFTKYKEIDNVDASIASKVYATIYEREVKNPHSPNVSASEETSVSAFAGTNLTNKNITVYFKKSMSSDDGTRQKLMTDYYNAASTLNHEDDHAAGLTSNGFDHFKIGVREATNRFQSKVSKYYKENLISNMRSYLTDQVNAILGFRNKGDKESEGFYLKEYEKNLKTFNRLFGENDKSVFKVLEEKSKTNKSPSNP